jgi:hypothetical protein
VTTCGRLTKRGRPCQALPMTAVLMLDGFSQAPACRNHLTAEEHIAHLHALALGENLRRDYHQRLPVECHGWPVTDGHRLRAQQARDEPDPDRADALAWSLLARGWLCRSCNISEGFPDVPGGRLERYRAACPAAILGVRIIYCSPVHGLAEPAGPPADLDRSPGYALAGYLAAAGTGS